MKRREEWRCSNECQPQGANAQPGGLFAKQYGRLFNCSSAKIESLQWLQGLAACMTSDEHGRGGQVLNGLHCLTFPVCALPIRWGGDWNPARFVPSLPSQKSPKLMFLCVCVCVSEL